MGRSDRERVRQVLSEMTCPHCDWDEAEGLLMSHCDSCCRRIVRALWELFVEDKPFPLSFDAYERLALLRALDKAKGNRKEAALLLGVGKSTLHRKMVKHGLT